MTGQKRTERVNELKRADRSSMVIVSVAIVQAAVWLEPCGEWRAPDRWRGEDVSLRPRDRLLETILPRERVRDVSQMCVLTCLAVRRMGGAAAAISGEARCGLSAQHKTLS